MPRLVALWWPVLTTVAQPQDPSLVGWRMVDRFAGFRYEVKGPHVVQSGFHTAAEKLADELGCFGWIQDSEFRTVVGEARCAKTVADRFKAFVDSTLLAMNLSGVSRYLQRGPARERPRGA